MMWTPRRLLLVVFGLGVFAGGFLLYSTLFGWIDGLPPLPDDYTRPVIDGRGGLAELPGGVSPIISRLRIAFGQDCIEQSYKLKFESREKGLVFAAAESEILPDGRVKLNQVSVAIFGKNNHDLTTVHSDEAFLTFDQPVRKIDDMGTRKVTAAELHASPESNTSDPRKGKVLIVNNRKTPEPDDDLIFKTPGPLYYLDEPAPAQPHIWTFQAVELTDRQNRPLPTQAESQLDLPTLTGEGMRVFLIPAPPSTGGPAPAGVRPKHEAKTVGSVNGVDHIEIDHHVFMNLWTAARNSFVSEPKKPAAKSTDGKPEDKLLVTIQTNGPFSYDMVKEFAHFEVPPKKDPRIQDYVKVTRHSKGNLEDTLTSDYLDVQFKRRKSVDDVAPKDGAEKKKAAAPPATPANSEEKQPAENGAEENLELETVHAWGNSIALSSDQDSLFAFGNDLYYDTRKSQTVLKGVPMHAVKSGNLIRAPELLLANLDDPEKQSMRAPGPGVVGMGDFDPKTQEHSQQAHFQNSLSFVKIKERGKNLDFITLDGNASFVDTLNGQSLHGRVIKLWMLGKDSQDDSNKSLTGENEKPAPGLRNEPNAFEKKTAPDPKPVGVAKNGNGAPAKEEKQLPHRLEATGDVKMHSAELIIAKSDYLNVWFKDIPPPPPAVMPEPAPSSPPVAPVTKAASPKMASDTRPAPPAKKGPSPKKEDSAKKDPPLIIRQARRIEAWVNRVDGINELDKVHNEGNVVIHQDPTDGNETGVDIAGHTVDVEHFVEGNYLVVEGNDKLLGQVHFDSILIVADDIKIDQRDNTASVKGPGSMRLRSKTTLDGAELETPSFIDIYWNDGMELDGAIRSVRYEGAVQAKQNESRVLCETMQVWLDRPLYLNQATKPKPPPGSKTEDKLEFKPKLGQSAQGAPARNGSGQTASARREGDGGRGASAKPVARKQAQDDDSPKVEKVLCDQLPPNSATRQIKPREVSAEDSEMLNGHVIKYQHTVGTQIEMDNVLKTMTTFGPGTVRIFQSGSSDPATPAPAGGTGKAKDHTNKPAARPKKKDEEETKLTWVRFDRRVKAFNIDPKRAVFYNSVALVHMPARRHDLPIDITKLPADALYLTCAEMLEISTLTRKAFDENGNEIEIKWQEMKADGNVRVRHDDCNGWAHTVTYSEEKSLLVFKGSVANPAVFNKVEVKGLQPKTIRAERITYNLKTKDVHEDNAFGGSN